jgi:predicted NAD/FAD-binding protein
MAITSHMNMLQSLFAPQPFRVIFKRSEPIDLIRSIRRLMRHSVYITRAVAAQTRCQQLNGITCTSFCGAHWGCDFQEYGVNKALTVRQTLGRKLR